MNKFNVTVYMNSVDLQIECIMDAEMLLQLTEDLLGDSDWIGIEHDSVEGGFLIKKEKIYAVETRILSDAKEEEKNE